jgi:predicted ester cyclase
MKTTGMSILRFSNGQIQEEWIVTNQAHISRQLGWDQLPEPPAPPTD